ncbi:MAG TPA: 3-hydroxybutyryl-CoA dehydrogenase [Ruminococcaceae bacterium]|nr:3-hydroxybutyryl-CoA dehydrogenase [Oscillospiraceae bacterium]
MSIGVIGAGVMGRGVAERFAVHGYHVILVDNSQEALTAAAIGIKRRLGFARMTGAKLDIAEILERISYSGEIGSLSETEFIIENVVENADVKKQVYGQMDKAANTYCIFISNTSCIPITEIGVFTGRADRVIGSHFMNPASTKNFAEVIKGYHTSKNTVSKLTALLSSVDIECEVINDGAGFVSNRLSHLFMNEAANVVYEGIATPKQVDAIFKKGFGHSMGPLETADLIGLDTVVDSLKVLYDNYQDPKFRVCPLLKKMTLAGVYGRKSGKGFYQY